MSEQNHPGENLILLSAEQFIKAMKGGEIEIFDVKKCFLDRQSGYVKIEGIQVDEKIEITNDHIFKHEIYLFDCEINNELIFKGGNFNKDFKIFGGKFDRGFTIYKGKFNGGIYINDAKFQHQCYIGGGEFNNWLRIGGGEFTKSFTIENCKH